MVAMMSGFLVPLRGSGGVQLKTVATIDGVGARSVAGKFGFSIWMAGGGIRGGTVHGATDELGFHAVEDRHYVTDVHATVMKQLGLDARKLEVPGRKRLEIDYGHPIDQIIA